MYLKNIQSHFCSTQIPTQKIRIFIQLYSLTAVNDNNKFLYVYFLGLDIRMTKEISILLFTCLHIICTWFCKQILLQ